MTGGMGQNKTDMSKTGQLYESRSRSRSRTKLQRHDRSCLKPNSITLVGSELVSKLVRTRGWFETRSKLVIRTR